MNRQIIEQIRDHHLKHIAWVTAKGFGHIDLERHQRWVDELDAILANEWFTDSDVVNALSAAADARKVIEGTKKAA
ncbi:MULTISPECIES: hypothetical protein [unclassified Dyella]|uniref:hypothetical protein n=1 Tax=unclassified Dyella TaxID=2634549 RepID=UPI000C8322C0|nr:MULTISPECIES: hypothetical protein [unclassified Dyella]MDR3445410.1 hypothetical protein [Dyella sp.]PMQ05800.1 hypothetical protein DyAD56_07850 [Dyella sp. AD56]